MLIVDLPRVFVRLVRRSRRRPRCRSPRTAVHPALAVPAWLEDLQRHALAGARLAAVEVIEKLSGHLGRWQQPRLARFDAERGSLLLVLTDGAVVTLAVDRSETAEALCAALRLGGLQLRMSAPEPGLLRLYAVWEHWHGVVEGIPATGPVEA